MIVFPLGGFSMVGLKTKVTQIIEDIFTSLGR